MCTQPAKQRSPSWQIMSNSSDGSSSSAPGSASNTVSHHPWSKMSNCSTVDNINQMQLRCRPARVPNHDICAECQSLFLRDGHLTRRGVASWAVCGG